MNSISKHDKKIWQNYVSNFEKFVIIPEKNRLTKYNKDKKNTIVYKNSKTKNYSKFTKKKGPKPEAVLDLHGHSLFSGKLVLNKYIVSCYEKSIRNVLIITGKGINNKGVLKEEVPKWLNDKSFGKFLINYNIAPKHLGGEGALLVKIKNKQKNIINCGIK